MKENNKPAPVAHHWHGSGYGSAAGTKATVPNPGEQWGVLGSAGRGRRELEGSLPASL